MSSKEPPLLLVTVGTDHHPFNRLIEWIDRWLADGGDGRVRSVIQHGASRIPKGDGGKEYLEHDELQRAMREAAIVVSHGGPATVIEARRTGHLPIVVPRDGGKGEHVDDHQQRFARRLGRRGLVVCCESEEELRSALEHALAAPMESRLSTAGEMARGEAPVSEPVRLAGELIDGLLATGHRGSRARNSRTKKGHLVAKETVNTAPVESAAITATPRPGVGPDQTNWPAVSVVIPTRNRPALLRLALDSILGQDYPGDVRCVVVFDQSEPDVSLLTEDPHRQVKVTTNTRSPGLAGGRNSGILESDGELVAFCDDDDIWLPGKLRAQVGALVADPGAALVSCGIRVDYDDIIVDRSLPLRQVRLNDLLRSRLAELHPSTFLMRRSALLDSLGLIEEDIPGSYAEDYEFLLRAAKHAPIINLPEVYVRVLWHKKSFFLSRWETITQALIWLLQHYPDFRTEPKGYARVAGQIAFAEAALGKRREARRWAMQAVRSHPGEARAYLALAVASGTVSADMVLRQLHKRGRGL